MTTRPHTSREKPLVYATRNPTRYASPAPVGSTASTCTAGMNILSPSVYISLPPLSSVTTTNPISASKSSRERPVIRASRSISWRLVNRILVCSSMISRHSLEYTTRSCPGSNETKSASLAAFELNTGSAVARCTNSRRGGSSFGKSFDAPQ